MTTIFDKEGNILPNIDVDSITEIEIPDWMTEISDFGVFKNLVSIIIPETVKHVEEGAFSGCTNLQSVTILGSETEVDKNAFDCCEEVLTIPLESHINPNAFGGSRPKELHVIGKVANPQVIENLYQALNLNGIRFFAPWNGETHFCGHTFTSEHGWMFDEKEQITFMLLTDHDGEYGDWDLVEEQLKMPNMPELYYGIFKDACPSVISLYQDDTLILPPNLKIIKQRIFDEEYISFPRIILPKELKVIESFAFYHTGLKDITIPSSTWLIDNGALCTCEHTLVSIRFEGKVNNIAAESISENGEVPEGLKKIIVPKGMKEYYTEKLSGCKGIEDIIVEE